MTAAATPARSLSARLRDALERWPIGIVGDRYARPARVAYYLWRFPILSETFIRRELRALTARGLDITVIADAPGDGDGAVGTDEWIPPTRYLLPIGRRQLARDVAAHAVRRPLRLLNLLAYILFRPYRRPRTRADDLRVFFKAVHLAATLRRAGIGHVHAPWGDTNAFVAMVAARLAGIGFSVQFRAHDLHRRTSAFLVGEKIRHARFVVTNTDYNLGVLRAAAAAGDRSKIQRIYNGVELAALPPAPSRAAIIGEVNLLSVGRLIEQKGFPYLFEACRTLRERGYAIRCRVIGGPELPDRQHDLDEIEQAHARLAVAGYVALTGPLPFTAVREAYQDADIFVLPCVIAGDGSPDITPNSVLEAMASALPVVSTRITALPELVEDGVSGILVPPRDAGALADAIARLIDDPALAARMGRAARRRVEERFDIETNAASYMDLFARL